MLLKIGIMIQSDWSIVVNSSKRQHLASPSRKQQHPAAPIPDGLQEDFKSSLRL